MAVVLEHPFSTAKPIDESWEAILDLERVVPAVQGGTVLENFGYTVDNVVTRALALRARVA